MAKVLISFRDTPECERILRSLATKLGCTVSDVIKGCIRWGIKDFEREYVIQSNAVKQDTKV